LLVEEQKKLEKEKALDIAPIKEENLREKNAKVENLTKELVDLSN